jgi:hypothetical protein
VEHPILRDKTKPTGNKTVNMHRLSGGGGGGGGGGGAQQQTHLSKQRSSFRARRQIYIHSKL